MKVKKAKGYPIYKQTWKDKRLKKINWGKMKNRSVLDLGCAQGILALKAKKKGAGKVVGVDIEPNKLQTAKDRAKKHNLDIDFFVDDIESESFKKRMPRFDFIFFCAMLSHMHDGKAMLKWIDKHTNIILYFGTNYRHSPEKETKTLRRFTSFVKIRKPQDISDVPNSYYLIACSRDGHDVKTLVKYGDLPTQKIKKDEIVMRTFEDLRKGQKKRVKKLSKNIQENGIIVPLLVMKHPRKEGYKVVEGGNRAFAADYLGLNHLPVKIISKDEFHKNF